MSAKFILAHATARSRALAYVAEAPDGWVVSVKPAKRTPAQNDHVHPLVRAIARQAGRKDEDQVRLLLVEQWGVETGRPQKFVRSLDGARMVDVSNSTKELDKPEAAEFIDWLYAWGALHGVVWSDEARKPEPALAACK
jgi:hypothetical protein